MTTPTEPSPCFVTNVQGLSRFPTGSDAPIYWGIIGLILIEMSVVAAFSISYFYLQIINPQWPPAGYTAPDLLLPTISLILLLVSCVTMYLASRAINKNQSKLFVIYTAISVILAGVVLIIRWQQFASLEVRWDEHVYGSLIWTMSGFHFMHVVSAAIGTAVIALLGCFGYFDSKRKIAIVVDTMYWNFVALAWIPFYLLLYWVPRFS